MGGEHLESRQWRLNGITEPSQARKKDHCPPSKSSRAARRSRPDRTDNRSQKASGRAVGSRQQGPGLTGHREVVLPDLRGQGRRTTVRPSNSRRLAGAGLIAPTTEVKKASEDGRWSSRQEGRGLTGYTFSNRGRDAHRVRRSYLDATGDRRQPLSTRSARTFDSTGPQIARRCPRSRYRGSFRAGEPGGERQGSVAALRLIGAGIAGTLLVVGLLMGVFGDWGTNQTTGRPGDGADSGTAEGANRWDGPRAGSPSAPEPNKLFIDAKQVLLDRLSNTGGSPEANVNTGIDLLTKHLARPDATDRQEATLLLEHARVAISDEKALQLLLTISDFDRSELAGLPGGFGRADLLIVPKSRVDALCPGFSERMKTQSAERRAVSPWCSSPANLIGWVVGTSNSIETAFYETLKKNVNRAIQGGRCSAGRRTERRRRTGRKKRSRQAVLQELALERSSSRSSSPPISTSTATTHSTACSEALSWATSGSAARVDVLFDHVPVARTSAFPR